MATGLTIRKSWRRQSNTCCGELNFFSWTGLLLSAGQEGKVSCWTVHLTRRLEELYGIAIRIFKLDLLTSGPDFHFVSKMKP